MAAKEYLIDTLMNNIPVPQSNTSEEIPQEGLYNQYNGQQVQEVVNNKTRPFAVSFTSTGSYTLPFPVVITGIYLTARAADYSGAASAYVQCTVAGNVFIGPNLYVANDTAHSEVYIPISNWEIGAGEIVRADITVADGSAGATIIGYKV